ncbi:MAG: arginine--tRNA ligase [Sedimentisphaerales bacterium]|nr:arginine--tRNA ligase [Sedimentisphaerales bacterium]
MQPVIDILDSRVAAAMKAATDQTDCAALVKPSANPKFGDYQANGIMALAKNLKINPRELAEKVVKKLNVDDICEIPEIAGPGFINLRLKKEFIAKSMLEINADADNRLAVDQVKKPQNVVVDFSGPNIAKQMHVGHLRSTIIGDAIARMLDFLGHDVVRQNHIGDWGTQFGMLIAYLKQENPEVIKNPDSVHIGDLEQFYKDAKQKSDDDADFNDESRKQVVNLHNHHKETIMVWQHIVDESRKHYQPIYDRLSVDLHKENERGESFYADRLADVVKALQKQNLAEESDGAICVFSEGFKNKEGQPLPFIIQKTDGAFLYATTDLAAIHYRINELKAKRIIYVTDARQKLHFQMLFAVTKAAGWAGDDVKLEHVTFGTVLGEDGKPLKTRSGENVKLKELLDEAVSRARGVVEAKNPELSEKEKENIANTVGIGAIKYADYSNNRESDYVFSFDKMLAMEGNTAPYMQYAFARIKSIERKAADKGVDIEKDLKGLKKLNLTDDAELDLGKHILRYAEAIEIAAAECRPNYLTTYLYELSQKFSTFYTSCPVLVAENEQRPTRLLLCKLTEKTIQHGLTKLLGIEVVEKM